MELYTDVLHTTLYADVLHTTLQDLKQHIYVPPNLFVFFLM